MALSCHCLLQHGYFATSLCISKWSHKEIISGWPNGSVRGMEDRNDRRKFHDFPNVFLCECRQLGLCSFLKAEGACYNLLWSSTSPAVKWDFWLKIQRSSVLKNTPVMQADFQNWLTYNKNMTNLFIRETLMSYACLLGVDITSVFYLRLLQKRSSIFHAVPCSTVMN